MQFLNIINSCIIEKARKFKFNPKIKISIFSVVTIDPRNYEEQVTYLTSVMTFLEIISGQLPMIKKIFFKSNSKNINFLIQSSNISKNFLPNFFIFLCIINFAKTTFADLFINLKTYKTKNNLLIKIQNATVLSHFYGNLEKYSKINVKFNLYAHIEFFDILSNVYYCNIINNI